ncbi:TonB-dependent receptor [Marinilabiliaceae bacterium N1Y90]|nr:TonB-dependent receptor [Marinilabiliaceae bacterium N1Y90]
MVATATQLGESSGLTKLNHNIANYLPGNGDNSVFNLLRLQPGILAAGEQPNDLIIWGSPEGTSRVLFDGFTIWGLKNFNDNISAVNPYLAKNVEVLKGGYDASNEDMIGGIVNISGKNGNKHHPHFNFFINNQTLNTMLEFPIKQKSSVMLAYRQTYYDLFKASDLGSFNNNSPNQQYPIEVQTPDYDFRDANFKYTFQGDNKDLFFVSLFAAGDDFSFDAKQTRPNTDIIQSTQEESTQIGGSIYYGKTWEKGHSSDLKLSFSQLNSQYKQKVIAEFKRFDASSTRKDLYAKNDVNELNAEWNNKFLLNEKHTLNSGIGLVQNTVVLNEDTFDIKYIDMISRINRLNFFIQDEFQLNRSISLKGGLRFNYPTHMQKAYIDPRLSISVRASGRIKLNASWGRYHQFLVKSSVVDNDNYRYTWTVAGYNDVPVMESEHWVAGAAYNKGKFLFSIDGFHKKNNGLTRFIRYKREDYIFNGTSRSYGLDFYAKQDFKGHSIWAGYSLSKTEELFPYFRDQEYRRSPQDQRHEFKTAALLNLGPFHLSASYIYGSGFPFYEKLSDGQNYNYIEPDYNRMDASLIYKLSREKFTGEIGLSILNLFDYDNVKFSNFERVPFYQLSTVYLNNDAVPFTPLLYLKIKL